MHPYVLLLLKMKHFGITILAGYGTLAITCVNQAISYLTGTITTIKDSWKVNIVNLCSLVNIQLPTFSYTQLLNKPYENEVTLTGQNPPLICCQHLEIQYTVRKKSRSFNAENLRSIDRRAAKLLAIKF